MQGVYALLLLSIVGSIIGSLIGILKKPSIGFMYNMLAFAAGVMLSISFLQLIPESIRLSSVYMCCVGILIGSICMFILDKLIPHIHPGLNKPEKLYEDSLRDKRLNKTAIYLMLGISLHNIPEGMAIGVSFVSNFNLSLLVAIAIAVHDIPEAICTSAPYFYSTGKRAKAFILSSLTALATVVGFFISYFLFQDASNLVKGIILASVAGIMIYISADELIPVSCNKDNCVVNKTESNGHSAIFYLIAGIIFVILLSLIK